MDPNRKYQIIKWIVEQQNPEILLEIEQLIQTFGDTSEWKSIPEELTQILRESEAEYRAGNTYSNDEAWEMIKKQKE